MRTYGVNLAWLDKKSKLIPILNKACFSSVGGDVGREGNKTKYFRVFEPIPASNSYTIYEKFEQEALCIYDFRLPETEKYIDLLIGTINKITPCELVTNVTPEYIKIKLLKTYDQSLVLLNFIRNLWYTPTLEYYKVFFESLEKQTHKSALSRLMLANIEASKADTNGAGGHSNYLYSNFLDRAKVKTGGDLKKYMGTSVIGFLTS